MRNRSSCVLGLVLLAALSPLAACRVSEDAVAASEQMTATGVQLERFYGTLAVSVSETVSLYEVDAALTEVPFREDERKLPEAARAELLKRKEMAQALVGLASSMAELTHSKAPSAVKTAATTLGNDLIGAQALPSGSPVPAAVGEAGRALLLLIQQHEEKKAARAMDQTLAALTELFAKEQPVYDSLARTHLRQASEVAKDLVNADAVDMASTVLPALRPFDLAPAPPNAPLQAKLKPLALVQLQRRLDEETKREADASAAMLVALQEMSSRVHDLATGGHMHSRGLPFTLTTVEAWVGVN